MNPITKIIIDGTATATATVICLIFLYVSIYEMAHATQLPTPKARDMKPGSGV
jgi:hypothetical protein